MRTAKTLIAIFVLTLIVGAAYVLSKQFPTTPAPVMDTPPTVEVPPVYFDDSELKILRIGSAKSEIAFDKLSGAIDYVIDKTSGAVLVQSSAQQNLWAVSFNYTYQTVSSSDYAPGAPQSFTYQWNDENRHLKLIFAPEAGQTKAVAVTVDIYADEAGHFQMQLQMDNNWGYEAAEVRFPENLVFKRGEIDGALLPVMPGVTLQKGFFERGSNYEITYPGWPGVFADFTGIAFTQGALSLYSNNHANALVPVYYGFDFTDCAGAQTVCLTHNIRPRVKSGTKWTSPVVHLRVGESWDDSIAAFRIGSGLAQTKSLSEKLGEKFPLVSGAPLYKADADQLGIPFERYDELLDRIAEPGILHLVAYSPGGFDRNYPDFLPPAERFGTTAQLSQLALDARERGFVVMPYINPTTREAATEARALLAETEAAARNAFAGRGGIERPGNAV